MNTHSYVFDLRALCVCLQSLYLTDCCLVFLLVSVLVPLVCMSIGHCPDDTSDLVMAIVY